VKEVVKIEKFLSLERGEDVGVRGKLMLKIIRERAKSKTVKWERVMGCA
jgi:hypothetical protein